MEVVKDGGKFFLFSLYILLSHQTELNVALIMLLSWSESEQENALKCNNGVRNINSPVNTKVELCLGS